MSIDLDNQIREAIAATRHQAPSPIAWSDVLARSAASPSTTKSPAMPTGRGRLLMAAAAGLVLVLIAGLAVIGNDGSNIDPATTTPPTPPPTSPPTSERALADIEPGETAVPTIIPAGWTIEPLIDDDGLSWTVIDSASGRSGTVQITGALDSSADNEVVGIAGVEWEVLESVPAYRATFDQVSVVVLTSDFALDDIEPLMAGLRSGALDEHPGGVFKVRNIGTEFASTESGVLRAAIVNERLCWAFFGLDGSGSRGCQLDPFAAPAPGGVAVDDSVAVLTQFGTQISGDNRWYDTVIGVTRNDIEAVELEYIDGETVTTATADPRDQLGVRLFAVDKLIVRTDETSSLVSVSVTTPDEPPAPIPAFEPLAPGEILIPSFIPDGWEVTPAFVEENRASWQFSNSRGEGGGRVNLYFYGPDETPVNGGAGTLDSGRWEVLDTTGDIFAFQALEDRVQANVTAFGFTRDEIDPFIAGLRAGAPGDHPSEFFDTTTSGAIIATPDPDLVVRAAQVGDSFCWSLTSTISSSNECTDDAIAQLDRDPRDTDDGVATSDGVAVLTYGWTAVPENSTDPNAAIVTNIVRLMGVTEPSTLEVTVITPNGDVIIVPTAAVPDRPDLRLFALQLVVDSGGFSPDQIQVTR